MARITRLGTRGQRCGFLGSGFPFPVLCGQNGQLVNALRIRSSDRVCVVTTSNLGALRSGWPPAIAVSTENTINSIVRRHAKVSSLDGRWRSLPDAIRDEVSALNSMFISSVLDFVQQTARGAFGGTEMALNSRRRAFEEILDSRSRLHEIATLLQASKMKHQPIYAEVVGGVAACDSVTASLAGIAAVVMQEQISSQAAQDLRRANAAAHRDRSIARLASALLLPGLWLGFLGANVLPERLYGWEIQSESSTLIAAIVALLLAGAGWFGIPLIFKNADRSANE